MRIYVAGKYQGEVKRNVSAACEAGLELIRAGYDPFIPHLAHYIGGDIPEERWKKWGLNWLSSCDGMVVLSNSPGVEREIKRAEELDIPIFTLEELIMSGTELLARMLNDCASEGKFHDICDCWRCPAERECLKAWDEIADKEPKSPRLKRRYLNEARIKLKEVFDAKVPQLREPVIQ